MDYKKWWVKDDLENVQPVRAVAGFIQAILALSPEGTFLDFGCGLGRFAPFFPPSRYLGVDLNIRAVVEAAKWNADYSFMEVDYLEVLPRKDVVFTHTVLLHISDEDLSDVVTQLCKCARRHVVIVEIMDPLWRGSPPFFSHGEEDYVKLLWKNGFSCRRPLRATHPHYVGNLRGASDKLTTLIADKRELAT